MIVTLSANPQLIGQQIASALTTPSMPLSIISQAETKWTTIAQTLITNFQATGTIPNASPRVLGLVSPDGTTTITSSNGVLSVPMATTSSLGLVKPDNTTITVSSGILSAATATLSSLGIVEPDGTTITISAGGVISASSVTNTNYFLSYVSGLFDTGVMTGWNLYNDGASVSPVEGTGGVVSNLTFNINSITPLVGAFDARLVLSANNDQGEGLSYDFTVENAAVYQPIFISYYYTTTANYVDGDITLWIYDKTNNVLIAPSNQDIPPAATATYWSGYFIPNSNSTSYRLIYHISSTNTTGYTFELDQVFVGRTNTLIGTAISGWTAYTPTALGLGTGTVSVSTAYWRRVGSVMQIHGQINTVAAGSGSTYVTLSIPVGYTIDASVSISFAADNGFWSLATGTLQATIPVAGGILLGLNGTNQFGFRYAIVSGGENALVGANLLGSDALEYFMDVPISQWSTNINLVTDFTEYVWNTTTSTTTDQSGTNNGYGSGGAAIQAFAPGAFVNVIKRVTFQRPIQATDLIIFEIYDGVSWATLNHGGISASGPILDTDVYGISMTTIDSTHIDVYFANKANQGNSAWSTYSATYRWRVRKTSQGNFAEQTPVITFSPRDTTSRIAVNGAALPTVANFSTAIQVTGNFGVPAGAKAILAEVVSIIASTSGSIYGTTELAFSDNNVNTPSATTGHPHLIRAGFVNSPGQNDIIPKDVWIPLNVSGQFYTYTIQNAGGGTHTYSVVVKGYSMNGVTT